MENYEKYPIFVKKKKSKTCLILKRQKELQMDGNFDTSDINNLKRKKISRKDLANLSKGAKKKKKKHYKIPLVFVNKSDNIRTPTTTRVASIRLRLRTEGGRGGGGSIPVEMQLLLKSESARGSPRHATSNLCVRFEELSRATCFSRKIRLLASFPIPPDIILKFLTHQQPRASSLIGCFDPTTILFFNFFLSKEI